MQTYTNASDTVHEAVVDYQEKHAGTDYVTALRQVIHDSEESEIKAHAELARRIPAYQSEFKIKSYDRARDLVLSHDPTLSERVGGKRQPLRPGDVVDARANQYAREHRVSYGEAVKEVLYADDHLAMCYESSLPYLEGGNVRAYEESKPGAIQRLGALLSGAKDDKGLIDVELCLRVANLAPEIVREAAGERLTVLADQWIINNGMPGFHADNFPIALRNVRQDHPELVAASESGRLTGVALKEILFAWNW